MNARLKNPQSAREFMLAGKSHFTIVSRKTSKRFTYKIQKSEDGKRHYVKVLTGPDNTSSYTFMGTIFDENTYRLGRKSKVRKEAISQRAFIWLWLNLKEGRLPSEVEFWHQGKCGRCGRLLTDPTSIARGIGPICRGRLNDDSIEKWIGLKNEFARREAAQERAAYMYEMATQGV